MLKKIKDIIFSSSDRKELTVSSFWSVLGTIVSKVLVFYGWVIVANFLGKELYGEVGIVRSTINLFLVFVGSGLGLTATRYIAQYKQQDIDKIGKVVSLTLITTVIFGIIISVLFYWFSPELAKMLNAPKLTSTLEIGAILLFFGGLNGSLKGCLEGFQLFKLSAIANILFSITLFLGLYLGARTNLVENTFLGFLLANIVYCVFQVYFLWKELAKLKLPIDIKLKEQLPILIKFTIPAILSGAMVIPFKWVTETVLVNQPNGYEQMGLFSAIILFQLFLFTAANTINTPFITLMAKKKENFKLDKLNVLLPWFIGVLAALPLICFPEILGLFFDKEYIDDVNFHNTQIIILFFTIIMLYKQGIARIMVLNNLMWFSFFSNLVWGLTLILTFYFLKEKGALGLAWAYLVAYSVNIIIILPLYLKRKIIPRFLVFSPYAVALWLGVVALVFICYNFQIELIYQILLTLCSSVIFVALFYKLFNFSYTDD
ncbi:MAG: oligosaccharide flippase family protein [Mesonia hippocampi]|uniref:oligosaccharide flippase family protein n=1 Tax=Mesonia hippocampi TaxID=1628250 RepID=UPI003F9E7FE6